MLSDIRNASQSGWTYILVGVLIVVFAVFFGAPLDSCGGSTNRVLLAKVGSHTVHTDDLNPIYNRVFGSRRSVEDSQMLQQQALSLRSMLLIHLLADEATDAGLRVSDEEFQAYIKDFYRNPEFRAYSQRGQFEGPQYKNWVQYGLGISIPAYQDFKKRELLARKWLETLEMQFQAADWEVKELHELRNTQVDLEYVKFDPARLLEQLPISDEEVQEYVAANSDEIKKIYESKRSDYETPEQVQIRRVFILKPGEQEGDDAQDAAKKKFEDAKTRVQNEEFADVAGELSEDYAREKQGLMDWSTIDNLDQSIADAVKDAEIGDVNEVETDFAYMLIKLEDRKEATTTSLEEVREEIARNLIREARVTKEVDTLVAELKAKLAEDGINTFEEAVDALSEAATSEQEEDDAESVWDAVTVSKTGKFSLEGQDLGAMIGQPGMGRMPFDRVPGIGKSTEVATDGFKLTEDNPISDTVYTVGESRFMIRLAERVEADPETLEENRRMLEAEIRGARISAAFGGWQGLFGGMPQESYGPVLEGMLESALESGDLKLYETNHAAAGMLNIGEEEPTVDLSSPPVETVKVDDES